MTRLHLDETGLTEIADDGTITRPIPVAFQIWTLIGGWRPICNKHKMLFLNRSRYYTEHSHCGGDSREYPEKDAYLIRVPNYKRVWL